MFSLAEIQKVLPNSEIINCENPDSIKISKPVAVPDQGEDAILFLGSKSYLKEVLPLKLGAVVTTKELAVHFKIPVLVVDNPDFALTPILNLFFPPKKSSGKKGEYVSIDPSADIGENTEIGNFVTIEKNVKIGKNCILSDGARILEGAEIGDDSVIGSNTVIYHGVKIGKRFLCFSNSSIGGEGFRFVPDKKGNFYHVPQVGTVVIGDDVRVGSSCTIDRGGIGDTTIGDGTKIDNQVHVAHNCKIGKNCILAGKSALAGSVVLEDSVIVGGGVSAVDHVHICSGAVFGAGTGVRADVTKPGLYAGWDVFASIGDFQKFRANIKYLPILHQIFKRVKTVEDKLGMG